MRSVFAFFIFLTLSVSAFAQVKLSDKEFKNLVALGDLYGANNMCRGDDFIRDANALRTPLLDPIIDRMIVSGKGDTSVINRRFIARPDETQMQLWYALREMAVLHNDTAKIKLSTEQTARKCLDEKRSTYYLLDNYYRELGSGLAFMFNKADLKDVNIQPDQLGFKDATEKDIFVLDVVYEMIYGRYLVLRSVKKPEKLLEFAAKMPMIDGKPYFYYTDLNFTDFTFNWDKDNQSFKEVHLNHWMQILLMQFAASLEVDNKGDARNIFFNSLMSKPEYFQYCDQKATLQKLYDQSQAKN